MPLRARSSGLKRKAGVVFVTVFFEREQGFVRVWTERQGRKRERNRLTKERGTVLPLESGEQPSLARLV
jgi:uncharacterized DUF497 family protein